MTLQIVLQPFLIFQVAGFFFSPFCITIIIMDDIDFGLRESHPFYGSKYLFCENRIGFREQMKFNCIFSD